MRVVLVHMPWGALDTPSLAVGILGAVTRRAGHETVARYANLDFADWASREFGLNGEDYRYFSDRSYFLGLGDWAFAGALYDDPAAGFDPEYAGFIRGNGATEGELELARTVRAHAPDFIALLADDLARLEPDLVGFTTTFQQNTASLAAARAVKRIKPRTLIAFGGANCDGPQGAALHRAFPFVDFVIRGEGELALPALLSAIEETGGAGFDAIGGLCHRAADGTSVANTMPTAPLPPSAIAAPDYDAYFERLESSCAAGWVEPKLVVEGARGCWWGEKHHCAFCGLNGSSMQFRSKAPAAFVAEVLGLARRHRLLDFIVVDNILDLGYFDTALPAFAQSGYDLRLHFEVKANLRRDQFDTLRESGVVQVQPGVENLSSRVLRIMDKGISGCQNVRALRDAQSAGVTMSWNYLYGFPGERDEDYTSVIDQLPALHHLDPPSGEARIVVERFSPYFNRPDLGFDVLRPAVQYRHTYRLPEAELMDLAYVFMAPARGIGDELAGRLGEALAAWIGDHPDSSLSHDDLGDRIVLTNTRPGYDWHVIELRDPVQLELFRLLEKPRNPATLAARLPGGEPFVRDLIDQWTRLGLLFHDGGHVVHVAVEADNQLLMRVQQRAARRTDWDTRLFVPGAAFGADTLTAPLSTSAAKLYRSGRRAIRLDEQVRLCADASPRSLDALVLLREMTALGAAVAWTASCDDGCVRTRRFAHLFPPSAVVGADPLVAREWRERYLPCMCVFRRGPGFVEVRDRRRGTLELVTLDEPDALAAIEPLLEGVAAARLPAELLASLREADLVAEQGGLVWWLPAPVHRWPNPSMIV